MIEQWERELVRKDRSPRTIQLYRWAIQDLAVVLDAVERPEDFQREHVRAWADELTAGNRKPSTKASAATLVGNFLRWAAYEHLIEPTLWMEVPLLRAPRTLPRPIPKPDLERLEAHYRAPQRRFGYMRDRALFWFLLGGGSRIEAALEVDRADYIDGAVVVVQKGGDEHKIITTEFARKAVEQYLQMRHDGHPALFITVAPDGSIRRMTDKRANSAWVRACLELGIRKFTNHNLRHTHLTALYEATHDLNVVKEQAGHRSIQSTVGYAQVSEDHRREVLRRLEPVEPPETMPVRFRRRRRGGSARAS